MGSKAKIVWIGTALLGLLAGGASGCGSSGQTGGTCIAGMQAGCDCPGGTRGVQVCAEDGTSFGMCQCGGGAGGGSGAATTSSSSGALGACGDGIEQPGECNPANPEFYCPKDCGMSSSSGADAGDPCDGHVYYAGMVPNVPSVWVSGGLTSLQAGDDMCVKANVGADHVCDYTEVLAAEKNGELKAIPANTTAWIQRTTTAMVNGQPSAPGPGGRCNEWTYSTNHRSDGEYIIFQQVGVPTYMLDNDTVYDPNDGSHVNLADLQCGGVNRAILCCYTKC